MSAPAISIVVPSYDQARFLEQNLESLVGQDEPGLEILVVDGGSGDGSLEIIRSYADRIAWWVSEPDAGQSDALNKGFARARGSWLGWLNSDDTLLPGALTAVTREIRRQPDAAWLAGAGWFVDEAGERVRHYDPPAPISSAAELSPWRESWFAQPGTFMRRELFEKAGGKLRTDLRYAMDLDLWLRLARHAPLVPVDADLATYRLHGASKTVSERAAMEVEIVEVLHEHLGWEAALDRVRALADERFELERRHRSLVERLRSPAGIADLARRHGARVVLDWLRGAGR